LQEAQRGVGAHTNRFPDPGLPLEHEPKGLLCFDMCVKQAVRRWIEGGADVQRIEPPIEDRTSDAHFLHTRGPGRHYAELGVSVGWEQIRATAAYEGNLGPSYGSPTALLQHLLTQLLDLVFFFDDLFFYL